MGVSTPPLRCYDCGQFFESQYIIQMVAQVAATSSLGVGAGSGGWGAASSGGEVYAKVDLCPACAYERLLKMKQNRWGTIFCVPALVLAGWLTWLIHPPSGGVSVACFVGLLFAFVAVAIGLGNLAGKKELGDPPMQPPALQ